MWMYMYGIMNSYVDTACTRPSIDMMPREGIGM